MNERPEWMTLYEELTHPIDQANTLLSGLRAEQVRWRGNPVMTTRMNRLVAMAERRVRRRISADLARWRYEERDAQQSRRAAEEESPF